MTLDDIKLQYEQDSKIDVVNLDSESIKIPQLHGKYYAILIDERLAYKKLSVSYDEEFAFKFRYYSGKASEEELKERGIEQFALKVLKQDIDVYLRADTKLNELSVKIEFQKIKIEYLESIIKEINNRNWNIRNVIEWKKFINGVN